MSEDQDEPNLPSTPRNPLRERRAKQDLARKQNLSPAARPMRRPADRLTPVEWTGIPQSAQMLVDWRQKRRRQFLIRLALFCGVPTLLTFLYMALIASPRYVSEFKITYQVYQPPTSLATGLVQSFLGANAGSTVDLSTILYQYIRSEALLNKVDSQVHVREYYSSKNVDFLSRMSPKARSSTFLRYYLWYVSVSQDEGGYLTVGVQAFDPDYAQKLANAIAKGADEMVDDMSAQARRNEVAYAEDEVKKDETRLVKARLALTDFQNQHKDINPQGTASQYSGIVGQLETQLSTARSQLIKIQTITPQSPEVTATRNQISALEQQIKIERDRLATDAGGTPYSELLNQYSALQFEEQFAQSALLSAQQGLELAHADAARRQNYVIAFAPPNRSDNQRLEFTLEYTLTVLVGSVAMLAIGSLLFGALRDHGGM
jgi:capsular polysaccharide transport system permease protein